MRNTAGIGGRSRPGQNTVLALNEVVKRAGYFTKRKYLGDLANAAELEHIDCGGNTLHTGLAHCSSKVAREWHEERSRREAGF